MEALDLFAFLDKRHNERLIAPIILRQNIEEIYLRLKAKGVPYLKIDEDFRTGLVYIILYNGTWIVREELSTFELGDVNNLDIAKYYSDKLYRSFINGPN